MPSPFPGMDPYIEGQRWQDFHGRFLNDLADLLLPAVRPRYVLNIEQYVYLVRDDDVPHRIIELDIAVMEMPANFGADFADSVGTATVVQSRYC